MHIFTRVPSINVQHYVVDLAICIMSGLITELLSVQLSFGNPLAAVCARGDLDKSLPDARGCYDTKVTSYDLALQLKADAISGPTTEVRVHSFKPLHLVSQYLTHPLPMG